MERGTSFDAMLDRIAASGDAEKETIEVAKKVSSIIDAITEARIKRGITQRQLANECGIKQSAIARMESFQVMPRLDTIIRIANHLNVSICVEEDTTVKSNNGRIIYMSSVMGSRNYKWEQSTWTTGKELSNGAIS